MTVEHIVGGMSGPVAVRRDLSGRVGVGGLIVRDGDSRNIIMRAVCTEHGPQASRRVRGATAGRPVCRTGRRAAGRGRRPAG